MTPSCALPALCVAGLCSLALESRGAETQDSSATSVSDTARAAISAPELAQWIQMRAGKNPLLVTGEGRERETNPSSATAGGFQFTPHSFLPWRSVDQVEVRGSNFGRWAIIGGLATTSILYISVASQGQLSGQDPGEENLLWFGGAVVGLTIGGIAGAFTHHWTPIWTQPESWDSAPATPTPAPSVAGTSGRSPVAAMRIGLVATATPGILALALGAADQTGPGDNLNDLKIYSALGVIGGPSVGLASGGRGDLAVRGLWIRGLSAGVWLGAEAVTENSKDDITVNTAKVVAVAGAAAMVVSCAHDLLTTRTAIEQGRASRVTLDLRRDGSLALSTRF